MLHAFLTNNLLVCDFFLLSQNGMQSAGALIGHPVEGVRVALTDGAAHTVDSSELAFKLACQYAFRDAYNKSSPTVLEPIMAVEVSISDSLVITLWQLCPMCHVSCVML